MDSPPTPVEEFRAGHPNNNGMLEVDFIYSVWAAWRIPVCISVKGVFHHAGYGG